LRNQKPSYVQSQGWQSAPIIVTDNITKDALNERAAQAYSERVAEELHWYYAIDTHNKQPITDKELQSKFENMNSAMTNQRLG